MVTLVFQSWLETIDRQIRKDKRNVILFVENVTPYTAAGMDQIK